MTSRQEYFLKSAASLREAYTLIDRLGEFFQVEHAWLFEGAQMGVPRPLRVVDEVDWVAEVNRRLDYVGFAVPEMYEALIHLAHTMENALRGWSEPEEPELPETPEQPEQPEQPGG